MRLIINVNGRTHEIDAPAGATLLSVIRDRLGLTGTKEGCVEGECGACTVLVDGRPVDSCIYAAHAASGRTVTTIEGIGGAGDLVTPLQDALVRTGGVQCGFCTPGFVMTLTALLHENPAPTESETRMALAGNLCRCTGYSQIIDAVMQTVEKTR
jgi:aerobic carbon-monoxide dehydrogenase small subunit